MASGLAVVVAVIIIVVVLVGLISTLAGGGAYEQIGQGGLGPPARRRRRAPEPHRAGEAHGERQQEIREILHARSERLVRQGKPPLDIEVELARLSAAQGPAGALSPTGEKYDPQLLAETRELILARNARRLRAGLAALDVEAELARTLHELGASGSPPPDRG